MPRFVLVTFDLGSDAAKPSKFKPVFDKALDWIRYAPNCWLLWTTTDAAGWQERLQHLVSEEDTMLAYEVRYENIEGLASQRVWDFLQRHKDREDN